MIWHHSDHATLNETKNPFPELICRFLKCAMVQVITDPDPAHPNRTNPASFPVVLGDFGCDVTCQACRENSPRTHRAMALGSKPPLVTRIARTGLGTRLIQLDIYL